MSLTSYQAAPPCNKWKGEGPRRHPCCQRLFGSFPKPLRNALARTRPARCVGRLSFQKEGSTKTNQPHQSIARRPTGRPVCRKIHQIIMSISVTPKDLLDAGVHFGHQIKRWNPRSKPFIFDHRQGVTIIDLGKTHEALTKACQFLEDTVGNGGNVLFVGTKRQAKDIVREAATSVNMPMCVDRWLGGTLTNYETVKKSVAKFKKYQAMETSGEMAKLPRKEESAIKREMTRMQKNFAGISDMGGLPSAMFVVDVNHHRIAVAEANRAGIPCVGIVDTNSDPTTVSHPIPGNDDAMKRSEEHTSETP